MKVRKMKYKISKSVMLGNFIKIIKGNKIIRASKNPSGIYLPEETMQFIDLKDNKIKSVTLPKRIAFNGIVWGKND